MVWALVLPPLRHCSPSKASEKPFKALPAEFFTASTM
jgi:hypothetical protein